MNKLNYAVVIAVSALMGAALYLYVLPHFNIALPNFTGVTSWLSQIPTHLQNLTAWIQAHLNAIIPTAAGVGTITTLLYNQVYKKAKQKTEQLQTQKLTDIQGELLKVTAEKQTAEQTSQQLQTQLDTLQQASQNVTQMQETITAQQKQIEKLTAERNEAERIFREKYFPTPQEPTVK